ncbi:TRAP transporter large permease subunit, partial [Nesterenkonia massiliensis]|uniref:TRAP transporter large permease subunit n=1 Tax=Nesterenkonia massiliensis TaxID=1232429 RepID=UPI0005C84B96
MLLEWLPLLMFLVLLVILFIGVPIAFALFGTAIAFALIGWGTGGLSLTGSAVWGVQNSFTLVAIPLFVLMSVLLEKTRIIGDLYDAIYKWSGGLRGGLAVATILVGAIIGAISGVVAAGVIGLALIAYPHMMRY